MIFLWPDNRRVGRNPSSETTRAIPGYRYLAYMKIGLGPIRTIEQNKNVAVFDNLHHHMNIMLRPEKNCVCH